MEKERKRLMGLDFGSKTVGVAVSDPLFLAAEPVEIIRREQANKLRRTYARIEELVVRYDVGTIVIGKPLMPSGDEGERVRLTEEFAEAVQRRTGLPVIMEDERLTTVEADEIMDEAGVPRKEHKKYVDMIAAQLILQSYMNRETYEH
ncbi:MAG: Holliday junction resolvase RuvX [Lachnospiraceae bacterium]|nr:Holliday junction resolvase RuvX [Lachnospiraceae bacterium]MBP5472220.1 Holliday junction resolvase RuvX [Lachnospiraceae bacterium]MBP5702805.1 Holliday junction resolvase RuvX [Lachnospiraceae bacterium]MBP5762945.1 Holliday junction resolvase RuvX [Lachnospiraceae bacterium]